MKNTQWKVKVVEFADPNRAWAIFPEGEVHVSEKGLYWENWQLLAAAIKDYADGYFKNINGSHDCEELKKGIQS